MTLVELSVVCFFIYLFGIITGWLGGGYYRNKEQEELVTKYNKTLDDLIELKEKYSRFK